MCMACAAFFVVIDDVIDCYSFYCANHARAGLLMYKKESICVLFMHKSVVVLNLCVHIYDDF